MEQKTIKRLKKRLERDKKRLSKELAKFAKPDPKRPGRFKLRFPLFGTKRDEDAQEVEVYDRRVQLERQLRTDLERVNKALSKIEKGIYGICEECGKAIDPKRLEVFAEARYCMECHKKRGDA